MDAFSKVRSNTFAAACYDQNTVEELEAAVVHGPDAGDMKNLVPRTTVE